MSNRSSWESRKLRYWTECTGQSRRAGLRTSHPAPAASPAQARLESRVLEQLGTSPSLCAHPFGIASLTSAATSLTLHLDPYMSEERYSFPEHCLSRLLPATPAPGSGDDVLGIPGLRVSGIEAGGRQLHLHTVKDPRQAAKIVLVLPRGLAEGWADIERRHRHWYEDNGLRPLWTTPHIEPVESHYLNAYPLTERSRARRAAVGSALLRRIALFHTVTAFYRVQCWDDGDSWKIDARTAHPRALWHDQLLQRLCHPRWGLPMHWPTGSATAPDRTPPTSGATPAPSTSTATTKTTASISASTPAPKDATTTSRSRRCVRWEHRRTGWPELFHRALSSTTTSSKRKKCGSGRFAHRPREDGSCLDLICRRRRIR
ncbi:hypothetical protein ABT300_06950 [Streptomyces sp. NPDC001027]|uniref:hypothetical protein n=1 Tax=Streptomyces sp. NPDC001027 TaxID=3154771 RepID=UPI003329A8B3